MLTCESKLTCFNMIMLLCLCKVKQHIIELQYHSEFCWIWRICCTMKSSQVSFLLKRKHGDKSENKENYNSEEGFYKSGVQIVTLKHF